jgi:hypothetical protein
MTSITELEDKANKVANLMFEKFNDTIKRNIENIDLYSNTFKNKVYIEELLNIYKNKNDNLKQQITNIKSTISGSIPYEVIQMKSNVDGVYDDRYETTSIGDYMTAAPQDDWEVLDSNPNNILNIDVVQFKFNNDYLSENDPNYDKFVIGLIAEDVFEKYPLAADLDDNGIAENWNPRFLIPAMLKVIQNLEKRIALLENK